MEGGGDSSKPSPNNQGMPLDAINNIDNSDDAASFGVLWHAGALLPFNFIKLLGCEVSQC